MQLRAVAPNRRGAGRAIRLTDRQLEVLALLCEGLPNKLISRRLNISPATVNTHISAILAELGVSSRLQAVVVAQRENLLGEPDAIPPAETIDLRHPVPGGEIAALAPLVPVTAAADASRFLRG